MGMIKTGVFALLLCASAPLAADEARDLRWDAMIGPANPAQSLKPKTSLPNVPQTDANPKAFVAVREGQWMSGPSIQYAPKAPHAVVPDLDGQRVRFAGYVCR